MTDIESGKIENSSNILIENQNNRDECAQNSCISGFITL